MHETEQSFSGLPSGLVRSIITASAPVASEIADPVLAILRDKDAYRNKLAGMGLLSSYDSMDSSSLPSTCGIDGCYAVESLLGSDIASCAAFAYEGLAGSGDVHWKEPLHRMVLHVESGIADITAILRALLAQKIVDLAVNSPHDIIMLRGSLSDLFVIMMKGLIPALGARDTQCGKAYLSGLKDALTAFGAAVEPSGKSPIWIGIPAEGGDEFRESAGVESVVRDDILFSFLLNPGEYAGPVKAVNPGLETVKKLQIKDAAFSGIRDQIATGLGECHIIYYRPREWTPAFRIEMPYSRSEDGTVVTSILAGVKHQCASAGIGTPYPLYCAGKSACSFRTALSLLRNSAVSTVAAQLKDNIGEMLPFLYANELGEDNG